MRLSTLVLGLLVFTAPLTSVHAAEQDTGLTCMVLAQEQEPMVVDVITLVAPGELPFTMLPVEQVASIVLEDMAWCPCPSVPLAVHPLVWDFKPPGHWLC
jgi:hypothetical protein